MSFNILKHSLVPEHHLLTKEETDKVLKEQGLNKDQLPKIFLDDPVIIYLRASTGKKIETGDVIKVIRKSHTSGISTAYRRVDERRD
jgi:DNA-directed RNA polymerase subunit H